MKPRVLAAACVATWALASGQSLAQDTIKIAYIDPLWAPAPRRSAGGPQDLPVPGGRA
jgi:hypothetical protein